MYTKAGENKFSSLLLRHFASRYAIFLFPLLLFAVASILSPTFHQVKNLLDILNLSAALGIVSLGQTFVILAGNGGVDLSVASVMSTVAVIMARNTNGQDSLFLPVMAMCILLGVLVGGLNGLIIVKRRVQPFMATMGTMIIVQGARFIYSQGSARGNFPPILRFLGTGSIGPIPVSVLSLIVFAGIASFVLKKTTFGRKIYAIGGNIRTARLSGYNTDLILIGVYIISGFMAAVGGLYHAGWIGISDNWVGKGYEMDSIAAVVMGGTTFEGGRGGALATIAGVLIMMMLYNLVLLVDIPVQVQYIVKGAVIILATSLYAAFRKKHN